MCELHQQLLELQQTGDSARVQCILRGTKGVEFYGGQFCNLSELIDKQKHMHQKVN
jgi:hypothetical protein